MPGWIGPWELAILLLVVLLVFGPKRLPEIGRSLGRGMRELKDSIAGADDRPTPDLDAPADLEQPEPSAPETAEIVESGETVESGERER